MCEEAVDLCFETLIELESEFLFVEKIALQKYMDLVVLSVSQIETCSDVDFSFNDSCKINLKRVKDKQG